MKIFSYGTFITSGIYQNHKNVRPAYLPGYIRIQRPMDPFPYVLAHESIMETRGFWGLTFEVDRKGLQELDYYEGSLYSRIHVNVVYTDGSDETVMLYYPTERTISQYRLRDYISDEDIWRLRILQHPEITEQFPELMQKTPPPK